MAEKNAHLDEPALELREGTPVSTAFGDVYFSRAGGAAETTHVFLQGNGLPQRWQGKEHFTIGELGFGTGLNFLVTLKAFRESADKDTRLHYISIEKFPFARTELEKVLALQPELAAEAAELLAAYPLRLPGLHRIIFGNIVLTLCFGDVAAMLPEFTMPVDAWFLDGFSPAKNEGMWAEGVLVQLGQHSAAGATFATFTAAGAVKRGLQAAGFTVSKVPGYGHKREMLVGLHDAQSDANQTLPKLRSGLAGSDSGDVIIIGAGIAGATLARAFAERGLQVTVLERHHIASGASGNAAGVLFPQLTKRWNSSAAWYFTAYGYALRQLQRWREAGLEFTGAMPGMLRLPRHDEEEAQLRSLSETLGLDATIVHWLARDAASAQAGLPLTRGAAFFPQGSWIAPRELCRALLQHPRITLYEETAARSITRTDGFWQVTLAKDDKLQALKLCIASAQESAELLVDYGLRLSSVGGQVSEFSANDVAAPLRSILCHKGYVIPMGERYMIGATYHREALLEVTPERHAENTEELAAVMSGWFTGNVTGGRSALRATTPDRMPYIGRLDAGLYVSTGHGSRGLLSAPLAAEVIASMAMGEQMPITADLRRAIDPLRFNSRSAR